MTEKSIQMFYLPTAIRHVDNQKFNITVILNIVFCCDINTINSNI